MCKQDQFGCLVENCNYTDKQPELLLLSTFVAKYECREIRRKCKCKCKCNLTYWTLNNQLWNHLRSFFRGGGGMLMNYSLITELYNFGMIDL